MKKLSAYTIARYCSDTTDLMSGIYEIEEAILKRLSQNRAIPDYFYIRLHKLNVKLNKLEKEMNTAENSINQITTALLELEAKGCHRIFFDYGNGLSKVRIFSAKTETVIYEQTINIIDEPLRMEEAVNKINELASHVLKTVFQCYKMEFRKDEYAGKWEKTKPAFEFGNNATSEMLIDGSGYYITDPDNDLMYFVDMKQVSEMN